MVSYVCDKAVTSVRPAILAVGLILFGSFLQPGVDAQTVSLADERPLRALSALVGRLEGVAQADTVEGVSLELMFLTEELSRLARLPDALAEATDQGYGRLAAACGDGRPDGALSLELLWREDCLAALLVAERQRWRLAAEIGAQLYARALEELVEDLPLPPVEADVQRDWAEDWWLTSRGPAVQVYARIGRHWIRESEGDEAADRRAVILDAIDRVYREPAAQQLRLALGQLPAGHPFEVFAGHVQGMHVGGNDELRLAAAVAATSAFEEALETTVDALLARGAEDICGDIVLDGPLAGFEALCPAAVAVLAEAVQTPDVSLDPAAVRPLEDEGSVQRLMLSLSERVETIHTLVELGLAVPDDGTCPAMLAAVAVVRSLERVNLYSEQSEDTAREPLDAERLATAASGLALLSKTCVEGRAVDWFAPVCIAALGEGAAATDDLRLRVGVDDLTKVLPGLTAIHASLAMAWNGLVVDAGTAAVGAFCEGNPPGTALGSQLDAFAEVAETAFREAALSEVQSVLDTALISVPVPNFQTALEPVAGLCSFRDVAQRMGESAKFSDQVIRSVLVDLEVIGADGAPVEEFEWICKAAGAPGIAVDPTLFESELQRVLAAGSEEASDDATEANAEAAETPAQRVATTVTWLDALASRLEEQGPDIALRAGKALVTVRSVEALAEVLSGPTDGDPMADAATDWANGVAGCGAGPDVGLGLRWQVENAAAALQTGPIWQANVEVKVRLVICGPVAAQDAEPGITSFGLERQKALLISTIIEADIDLTEDTDPAAVLNDAARSALDNVTIEAADLEDFTAETISEILTVAGLDPAQVALFADAARARWDAGLVLEFAVRLPGLSDEVGAIDLCLFLPNPLNPLLDTADVATPDNCQRAEDLGTWSEETLAQIAETLLPRALDRILEHAGLGDLFEGGVAFVGAASVTVQMRPAPDGRRLVLVVSEATLNQAVKGSGLRLLGPLEIAYRLGTDFTLERLDEGTVPRLDPRFLVTFLDDLPIGGILDVSPLGDGERCGGGSVFGARIAFGPEAPLRGRIGTICLDRDGGFNFERDRTSVIQTVDGAWQFGLGFGAGPGDDLCPDAAPGCFALELEVRRAPEPFKTLRGAELVLIYWQGGGWLVPYEENVALFGLVDGALGGVLPPGIRVEAIQLGSEGISVSFDADAATDALVNAVWLEAEALAGAVDWAAIYAAHADACSFLPLHGLAAMLATGQAAPLEQPLGQICNLGTASLHPLRGEFSPREMEIVRWKCDLATDEPTLAECELEIYEDLSPCNAALDLRVQWADGAPMLESDTFDNCAEELLGEAVALAGATESLRGFEFGKISLVGDCLNKPAACQVVLPVSLADGALDAAFGLDGADETDNGENSFGALPEACEIDNGLFRAELSVTLNGTGRLSLPGAETLLDGVLAPCLDALRARAVAALVNERGLEDTLDTFATAMADTLDQTRATLADVVGGVTQCTLTLRDHDADDAPPCRTLNGAHFADGSLVGVRLTHHREILGAALRLDVDGTFDTASLSPAEIGNAILLDERPEDIAGDLVDGLDIDLRFECEVDRRDCITALVADALSKVTDGRVTLNGSVQVDGSGDEVSLTFPLHLSIPEAGIEIDHPVECSADIRDLAEPKFACDHDLTPVVLQALSQGLNDLAEGSTLDLGVFALTLGNAQYEANLSAVSVPVSVAIPALELIDSVPGEIRFDDRLTPTFNINFSAFEALIQDQVTGLVKDLVGDFGPLEITAVKLHYDGAGPIPDGFAIDSVVNIAEIIKVSVPQVILTENGVDFAGPNGLTIEFPDGFQIPVPPIAICPNGGTISEDSLRLTAIVTIGECTASNILMFRGFVEVSFETVGKVIGGGDLVLIRILPLGRVETEMDLSVPSMSQEAELGGALRDVIYLSTLFEMNGDTMTVHAKGEIEVFTVPIGDGVFDLAIDTGILDARFGVDLGILVGDGFARTEAGFARAEAAANTELRIGGLPLSGTYLRARPRFVKLAISILGFRVGIVFPGIDAISEDALRRLIENLLTPDFRNIDKALAALFNGDITINPLAKFGSGGDGMGGDGDGDAGESGSDADGAGDPGEGLAGDGPPAEPAGDPGTQVGPGGLIGTAPTTVWFDPGANDIVRIGTGTPGGADEDLRAYARLDSAHFQTSGQPVGRTLALFGGGYGQILATEGTADCAWETTATNSPLAVLYGGAEDPRRGNYELCRIRLPSGERLDQANPQALDPDLRADLAAMNEALLGEMGARAPVPGGDYGRIVLRGELVVDQRGLRVAIVFQRPGEVLVSARGKYTDTACGETAQFINGEAPETRLFWLTGLEAEGDRGASPDRVIPIVDALWNCDPGTLARVEADGFVTETVASAGVPSGGYVAKDALAQDEEASSPSVPPWVTEQTEAAEAASEAARANAALNQRVAELEMVLAGGNKSLALCEGQRCRSAVIALELESDRCVVRDGGDLLMSAPQPSTGSLADCQVDPDNHYWLDVGSDMTTAVASVDGEGPETLMALANLTSAALVETEPLAFGIAMEDITPPDITFLTRTAAALVGSSERLTVAFDLDGGVRRLAVVPQSAVSAWIYQNGTSGRTIAQDGDAVDAATALPLARQLPAEVSRLRIYPMDGGRVIARAAMGDEWLIYSLEDGAWTFEARVEGISRGGAALGDAIVANLMVQRPEGGWTDPLEVRTIHEVAGYAAGAGDDGWIQTRLPQVDLPQGEGVVLNSRERFAPSSLGDRKEFRWIEDFELTIDPSGLGLAPGEYPSFAIVWDGDPASRDHFDVCLFDARTGERRDLDLLVYNQEAFHGFVEDTPTILSIIWHLSGEAPELITIEIGGISSRRSDTANPLTCATLTRPDVPDPVRAEIDGLGTAIDHLAALTHLAARVDQGEAGRLVVAGLAEVPDGRARTAIFQIVEAATEIDLLVAESSDAEWMARVTGAAPPEWAYEAIAARLAARAADPRPYALAASETSHNGIDLWIAKEDGAQPQVLIVYPEVEEAAAPRTLTVVGDITQLGDDALIRLFDYARPRGIERLQPMRINPLVLLEETAACAVSDVGCRRRLVHVGEGATVSVPVEFPAERAHPGRDAFVDIFAAMAQAGAIAGEDGARFDGLWLAPSEMSLFRVVEDGFLYAAGSSGWGCYDAGEVVPTAALAALVAQDPGLRQLKATWCETPPRLVTGITGDPQPNAAVLFSEADGDGPIILSAEGARAVLQGITPSPPVREALTKVIEQSVKLDGFDGIMGFEVLHHQIAGAGDEVLIASVGGAVSGGTATWIVLTGDGAQPVCVNSDLRVSLPDDEAPDTEAILLVVAPLLAAAENCAEAVRREVIVRRADPEGYTAYVVERRAVASPAQPKAAAPARKGGKWQPARKGQDDGQPLVLLTGGTDPVVIVPPECLDVEEDVRNNQLRALAGVQAALAAELEPDDPEAIINIGPFNLTCDAAAQGVLSAAWPAWPRDASRLELVLDGARLVGGVLIEEGLGQGFGAATFDVQAFDDLPGEGVRRFIGARDVDNVLIDRESGALVVRQKERWGEERAHIDMSRLGDDPRPGLVAQLRMRALAYLHDDSERVLVDGGEVFVMGEATRLLLTFEAEENGWRRAISLDAASRDRRAYVSLEDWNPDFLERDLFVERPGSRLIAWALPGSEALALFEKLNPLSLSQIEVLGNSDAIPRVIAFPSPCYAPLPQMKNLVPRLVEESRGEADILEAHCTALDEWTIADLGDKAWRWAFGNTTEFLGNVPEVWDDEQVASLFSGIVQSERMAVDGRFKVLWREDDGAEALTFVVTSQQDPRGVFLGLNTLRELGWFQGANPGDAGHRSLLRMFDRLNAGGPRTGGFLYAEGPLLWIEETKIAYAIRDNDDLVLTMRSGGAEGAGAVARLMEEPGAWTVTFEAGHAVLIDVDRNMVKLIPGPDGSVFDVSLQGEISAPEGLADGLMSLLRQDILPEGLTLDPNGTAACDDAPGPSVLYVQANGTWGAPIAPIAFDGGCGEMGDWVEAALQADRSTACSGDKRLYKLGQEVFLLIKRASAEHCIVDLPGTLLCAEVPILIESALLAATRALQEQGECDWMVGGPDRALVAHNVVRWSFVFDNISRPVEITLPVASGLGKPDGNALLPWLTQSACGGKAITIHGPQGLADDPCKGVARLEEGSLELVFDYRDTAEGPLADWALAKLVKALEESLLSVPPSDRLVARYIGQDAALLIAHDGAEQAQPTQALLLDEDRPLLRLSLGSEIAEMHIGTHVEAVSERALRLVLLSVTAHDGQSLVLTASDEQAALGSLPPLVEPVKVDDDNWSYRIALPGEGGHPVETNVGWEALGNRNGARGLGAWLGALASGVLDVGGAHVLRSGAQFHYLLLSGDSVLFRLDNRSGDCAWMTKERFEQVISGFAVSEGTNRLQPYFSSTPPAPWYIGQFESDPRAGLIEAAEGDC